MSRSETSRSLGLTLLLLIGVLWDVGMSAAESQPMFLEVGSDGVQRANVTLDSYSYTPNHLIVQAGIPVELTLNSVTMITPHNFVLKEQAAGLSIAEDVSAGKSKTIRFTATTPGTYLFYCDKKLLFFASHREKGMEGRLEVR